MSEEHGDQDGEESTLDSQMGKDPPRVYRHARERVVVLGRGSTFIFCTVIGLILILDIIFAQPYPNEPHK
jgi:hypothetical protein